MNHISHIYLLLAILPIVAALAACETSVDPIGLPYVERLVVRGQVNNGQPIDSIQITRTLPMTEVYTDEKAAVTDAEVLIRVDGQSYPLQHANGGFYRNRSLIAQAGKQYTLIVDWHGKHATATTVIPFPVPIDSAAVVTASDNQNGDSLLEAYFKPHGDQVYALVPEQRYYSISPGGSVPSWGTANGVVAESERIARRRDTNEQGNIHLRAHYFSYYSHPWETVLGDSVTAVLYTFDAPFYDYYQTFYNGRNDNGPFSSGGETVAWNVEGDGIGMFIGQARSERRVRP